MALTVRDPERDGETVVLEGTGTRVSVRAKLSRVTPAMTKLSVRVEAGRLTADKQTAEEIVNQVAASLAGRAVPAAAEVSAHLAAQSETLGALRSEVARLRSKLDEEGAGRRAPSAPPAGAPSVGLSAARGVGEASSEGAFPRTPPPAADVVQRPRTAVAKPSVQSPSSPVVSGDTGGTPSLAPHVIPVGLLAPVEALTGPRSGQ